MRKPNIDHQNNFTRNLIYVLDKMEVSQNEGADKIKDYLEYLSSRTIISKYRLKKMLTYNVGKIVALEDIDELSEALKMPQAVFFRKEDSIEKSTNR